MAIDASGSLRDFEAEIPERAAGIDGHDEILLGDADLVAVALMRVALLDAVAVSRLGLWASPIAADGDQHAPPTLLEAPAARDRAGRPFRPFFQPAVSVA